MPETLELFAACQPGFEPLLAGELRALGAEPHELPGGVAFRGDVALLMKSCLWLGTASHVRARIARFPCRALGELQRKAAELPWSDWLRPDVAVAVHATAKQSRVYHTDAVVERVEAALVQALGGPLPPLPAPGDDEAVGAAQLHVRFRDDVCTISVDATATPLHRRGYRLDLRKAPLREDIAHALVLASGWTRDEPLLDPFCGSGAIVIEAAGLARGLPPGRLRPPPLQELALFDADVWSSVRNVIAPPVAPPPIAAGDRDAGAVAATRANAARAGVADDVDCRHVALASHPWWSPDASRPRGVVVTNPPFGRRVRGKNPLLPLYQTLGHRVHQLGDGWRLAMLAHDVRLARRTGVPLAAAFTTRHGGLSVSAMVSAGEHGEHRGAGSATR